MKKYYFFLSLGILGYGASLSAQTPTSMATPSDSTMVMAPIQADRPDHTEGPAVLPKGYFQMEHGFQAVDTDPGFIYSYPSSLWRYGVSDNFEIQLATEYITIHHSPDADLNGFLPLKFGFKSKLTEQKGILPKISFLGHLTFPGIVSAELETTYFAPDMILAFQHNISNAFTIGYNVAAQWDGESAEPDFLYSLSASFALTNRLSLYGEAYGSTPQREKGPLELKADAGLTYLIGNNFLFDVSAGQGITKGITERYAAAGFSYRFKL